MIVLVLSILAMLALVALLQIPEDFGGGLSTLRDLFPGIRAARRLSLGFEDYSGPLPWEVRCACPCGCERGAYDQEDLSGTSICMVCAFVCEDLLAGRVDEASYAWKTPALRQRLGRLFYGEDLSTEHTWWALLSPCTSDYCFGEGCPSCAYTGADNRRLVHLALWCGEVRGWFWRLVHPHEEPCHDCGKPWRRWWRDTGDHDDCLPF